jgi:hypothetical protein
MEEQRKEDGGRNKGTPEKRKEYGGRQMKEGRNKGRKMKEGR